MQHPTSTEPIFNLNVVTTVCGRWVRMGGFALRVESNGTHLEVYDPRSNAIGTTPRGRHQPSYTARWVKGWCDRGCPEAEVFPPGLKWTQAPATLAGAWKAIPEKAMPYAEAYELWKSQQKEEA